MGFKGNILKVFGGNAAMDLSVHGTLSHCCVCLERAS